MASSRVVDKVASSESVKESSSTTKDETSKPESDVEPRFAVISGTSMSKYIIVPSHLIRPRPLTGPPDEECPICRTAVVGRAVTNTCRHAFCQECLERHVQSSHGHPSCPVCRTSFTQINYNIRSELTYDTTSVSSLVSQRDQNPDDEESEVSMQGAIEDLNEILGLLRGGRGAPVMAQLPVNPTPVPFVPVPPRSARSTRTTSAAISTPRTPSPAVSGFSRSPNRGPAIPLASILASLPIAFGPPPTRGRPSTGRGRRGGILARNVSTLPRTPRPTGLVRPSPRVVGPIAPAPRASVRVFRHPRTVTSSARGARTAPARPAASPVDSEMLSESDTDNETDTDAESDVSSRGASPARRGGNNGHQRRRPGGPTGSRFYEDNNGQKRKR